MSFWSSTLAARWRDARGRRLVALREFAGDLWQFLRETTPARRRARYGDLDYDFEQQVNTSAGPTSLGERWAGALAGGGYQPADPELFRATIAELPIHPAEFTFIDLGCGKGRALLLAAEAGFRHIIGVELLPSLHHLAEENVHQYGLQSGTQARISLWCEDARIFAFPSEPTVLFLFNPFPEATLAAVLDRFETSLAAMPRAAWIVYHNPVHEAVLRARGEWERVAGDLRSCAYKYVGN